MNCEFYNELKKPICLLWLHGGYPSENTCLECIKNGLNNQKSADEVFDFFKIDKPTMFVKKTEKTKLAGLGDVVYKVAEPIAKTIDKTFKTNIKACGGCKRRRDALNKAFPFK